MTTDKSTDPYNGELATDADLGSVDDSSTPEAPSEGETK
jgi:hypothetical protein